MEAIDKLLELLERWIEKNETHQEEEKEVKRDEEEMKKTKEIEEEEESLDEIIQYWISLGFSPPPSDSFLSLLSLLNGNELGLGYDLQFIDSLDEMERSLSYTECFDEFYTLSRLIPLLNHGDGRIFDLYDCQTGAIIQFNIMDSPSNWIVLSPSFEKIVLNFHQILKDYKEGISLPQSIYLTRDDNDEESSFELLKTKTFFRF